jgi:hypothetical protein
MPQLVPFYLITNLCLNFLPTIVFAGQSTALAEEIEAKKLELEKNLKQLAEDEIERKKVDEENSHLGDIDSPREEESLEELEA